jgi:Ser/Thr protein kinase RdoA (MazF antagonist)
LLGEHVSPETADRCEVAVAKAHQILSAADLPFSWIPLDLDAGNVLIENETVRFIDLDDSCVGAAPLALSTLLRRLRRMPARSRSPMWIDEAHRTYEECWAPRLELRGQWPDVEVASLLIECHIGWRQLLQKSERGEVHGALDVAATNTARRLARALGGGHDL